MVFARKRGAGTYFVKPFSPRDVAAWVNSRLSSSAHPSTWLDAG
ncbi:MAG: hypothetical protein WCJ76_03370 [Comamonadaceae bacterium]